MTIFFESHEITIYRHRRIGSANRFSMSATFTSHKADIQPASLERTQFVQGRFGKTYTAFVDTSADIKEGDQIRVTSGEYSGRQFGVKGVSRWEGSGLLDHLELIIAAQD